MGFLLRRNVLSQRKFPHYSHSHSHILIPRKPSRIHSIREGGGGLESLPALREPGEQQQVFGERPWPLLFSSCIGSAGQKRIKRVVLAGIKAGPV